MTIQLDAAALAAFREQVVPCAPAIRDLTVGEVIERSVPTSAGETLIRVYRPSRTTSAPLVVYVHGAGWVAGNLDSHDGICRYLCLELDAVVVAIDYRLAPEHPWPAAFDDVYDVVCWLAENPAEMGADSKNLVLAGESAGAHLTATVTLRARDEGGPRITQQLLLYAALDGRNAAWIHFCQAYFPDDASARSRYGSPVWVDDLAGLPPTLCLYGELEPSRSEQELYARKLAAAGVDVETFRVDGVGHGVYELKAASDHEHVLNAITGFVRRRLVTDADVVPQEGRAVTYSSYLRVDELLALQHADASCDQLLFTIVHQTHELWFKQALAEIEGARDAICVRDIDAASRHALRVAKLFDLLVSHWDLLSTLTPAGYLSFRDELGSGSGFQSVQFRELEFLCGLKDPAYLGRMSLTNGERARLQRRLDEDSLADALEVLISSETSPGLRKLLSDPTLDPAVFRLLEALMDLDEAFAVWRARHVVLVERQIGHKPGTGGSSGVEYLRRSTTKRLFPALWATRTDL